MNWNAANGAVAYVPHYADANESDPHKAIYMGYSEATSWTLAAEDVPAHVTGDKLHFWVMAYDRKGVGANDVEKARDLHDNHSGSAWSTEVVVTMK